MPDIVEITDEVFHVKHSNLFFQPAGCRPNSVRAMFHVKHFATLRVCGMKLGLQFLQLEKCSTWNIVWFFVS